MIPRLFEADWPDSHTTFEGHGLGDLVGITDCFAEEKGDEEDHEWELSFSYPETGELFNALKYNRIVVARANDHMPLQAFRIYGIGKKINHMVTVSCQHISYDLANIPVKPFKAVGASASLIKLKANAFDIGNKDNFTFTTDIPNPETEEGSESYKKSITVEFDEPKSMLKILVDGDESIKGKFGGDLVTDNYDISLDQVAGEDRGVTINYGVDLIDIDQETNITEMVTGIIPYYIREKNVRVDLGAKNQTGVQEINQPLVVCDNEYTLKAGRKYKLSFSTENTGARAYINGYSGFWIDADHQWFDMDGTTKTFEITKSVDSTFPAGTVLIYSGSLPPETSSETEETNDSNDEDEEESEVFGSFSSLSLLENYAEPILYGNVVNGPGTYEVPRIVPVDITEYFQDQKDEPTEAQITAKGQEWVDKEEIGQPTVSLTVSYAPILDHDVRLYDAVRVKFIRMGIDVKSKVTRFKYDVLSERCTEIDVGKTKDSAAFSLIDASRLKVGLLPPDRIADIDGSKIKNNSIGKGKVEQGAIGGGEIDRSSIDVDKLLTNGDAEAELEKNGTKRKPVVKKISVPDNVYGLYGGNVGYVFDPSLGVDWLQIPGWKDAQGHVIPPVSWHQNIPYDGGSGVGYCLDPQFVFDGSLDGQKKLTDNSVTGPKIANSAVTEEKIGDDAVSTSKVKDKAIAWEKIAEQIRTRWDNAATATVNFGKVIGPTMIHTDDDSTIIIPYQSTRGLTVTNSFILYSNGGYYAIYVDSNGDVKAAPR